MTDSTLPLASQPACVEDPDASLCRRVYDITGVDWLADGADALIAKPAKILLIVLVAFTVRALAGRAIRRIARGNADGRAPSVLRPLRERAALGTLLTPSPLQSERRRQRAETIGAILRSVTSFTVFTLAFILILGELGINLTPIIASAGIAGVALGFGAQNLVKDFLSGIFMILEDQYGVGDVIDAGPASGTVEDVGLRTTRLRDVHGTVWYVRNGEILRIGNKSQGYAQAVLDVPFPVATDVDRAGRVVKEVADTLWRDEQWAEMIIEEPKMLGVEQFTAEGVQLRLTAKTRPGAQWQVSRELRQRLKERLDREGLAGG